MFDPSMLNPSMLDPAVVSFFKQAGEAFKETVEAEAAGRMAKALLRHCGSSTPPEPPAPAFQARCLVYAAKGYAMAHMDGAVTMGQVRQTLAAASCWPPPAEMKAQGALFMAFMLGFLYGSELPEARQATIEGLIPMAAGLAAAPEEFARKLGISPEQMLKLAEAASKGGISPERMREMAEAASKGGLGALKGMFNNDKA